MSLEDEATLEMKRRACSLEGCRFIAEQLAMLNPKSASAIDIFLIRSQARSVRQARSDLQLGDLPSSIAAIIDGLAETDDAASASAMFPLILAAKAWLFEQDRR